MANRQASISHLIPARSSKPAERCEDKTLRLKNSEVARYTLLSLFVTLVQKGLKLFDIILLNGQKIYMMSWPIEGIGKYSTADRTNSTEQWAGSCSANSRERRPVKCCSRRAWARWWESLWSRCPSCREKYPPKSICCPTGNTGPVPTRDTCRACRLGRDTRRRGSERRLLRSCSTLWGTCLEWRNSG